VAVAGELDLGADDAQVVVVEGGDGAGFPWLPNLGEDGDEVDGRRHADVLLIPRLSYQRMRNAGHRRPDRDGTLHVIVSAVVVSPSCVN
jgi:hypothetical protein